MSTTYNMAIVGSASPLVATLNVTITYGTATSVIATKSSTTVGLTYDSTDDVWTGNLDSTGTWTVYATDGVRTVSQTVNVDEIGVYDISIAAPNVPLGYTQLEWASLDNTGVETNYYPVSACKIEGKIAFLAAYSISNAFRSGETGCYICYRGLKNYSTEQYINGTVESGGYVNFNVNNYVTDSPKVFSALGTSITVNGSTYSFSRTSGSAVTSNTNARMAITGVKFYYLTGTSSDGSTVVINLVPVKRLSDSAVGLYDKKGNVFYVSSNATAGPEVS